MSMKADGIGRASHGAQQVGLAAVLALAALTAPLAQAQSAAGMNVARDAVTGQLRPLTAEESKALEDQAASDKAAQAASGQAAPAADTTPMLRQGPNGAIGMKVGDLFLTYAVMTRNADGTMSMQCVTGTEAAEQLVNAPQSATAQNDKEHDHAHQ